MALQGAGAGDGGGNAPGDMHAPAVAAGLDTDTVELTIKTLLNHLTIENSILPPILYGCGGWAGVGVYSCRGRTSPCCLWRRWSSRSCKCCGPRRSSLRSTKMFLRATSPSLMIEASAAPQDVRAQDKLDRRRRRRRRRSVDDALVDDRGKCCPPVGSAGSTEPSTVQLALIVT
eukprot:1180803-Prorocentrum_minimum.AAC.4